MSRSHIGVGNVDGFHVINRDGYSRGDSKPGYPAAVFDPDETSTDAQRITDLGNRSVARFVGFEHVLRPAVRDLDVRNIAHDRTLSGVRA